MQIKRSLPLGAALTEKDKDAKQFPQQEWHPGMASALDHDLVQGSANF